MKPMLLIILAGVSFTVCAQKSDFLLLKKANGKKIGSFYKGSYISFITTSKEKFSGNIKKVMNDSVWVAYQEVMTGFTEIGGAITDTITYEAKRFAVKEIAYIGKEKRGFSEATLPVLLVLGGGGYMLLHTFNAIYQKDKIDLGNMGVAAGAVVAGILLKKLRKDYYYIGKRFRLQYVSL